MHLVKVSLDQQSWSTLLLVLWYRGERWFGMETISTVAGDAEYLGECGPGAWTLVEAVDFEPVLARHARIRPIEGDGSYAVGELAFFGVPTAAQQGSGAGAGTEPGGGVPAQAVPEPGSLVLLATGLLAAGLRLRRRGD